jgi:predicted O-linked N-acetylglucosamine transferase (SPINDLY family)
MHYTHRWVDVFKLNTRELVAKIVEDEIDILVDLVGCTAGNRLDAFSCCPAPVQVTWIGYPNTTGLSCMHYRVTDAVTDPVDTSQRFSEKLIRLPDCFLCHNIQTDEIMQKACGSKDLPALVSPPCLQNGYITFGCFNQVTKIQPAVLDLFIRILNQVPTSRINLKCGICFNAPCVREKWHAKFEAKGVARERVNLLAGVEEHVHHMSLYGKHDISLDTFPYGGTTTTVDSLLMGVPVVTLRTPPSDSIHAQNVSAGILTTLGLPDLIANSPDEYVHLASKLAANTERLVALRDNLRSDWGKSPMGDADRYRRNVEKMYQDMWGEYCEGSNWPPNSPDRDIA